MNIAPAPVMLPAPPGARFAAEGDLAGGHGFEAGAPGAPKVAIADPILGWLFVNQPGNPGVIQQTLAGDPLAN